MVQHFLLKCIPNWQAYPTNKLPDLRGEFIRGWDDGRGIDGDVPCFSGQDGQVFLITEVRHWSGHSINNYDQIVSNKPVFICPSRG